MSTQYPPSIPNRIARPNLADKVNSLVMTRGCYRTREEYMEASWASLMQEEELEFMFKDSFGGYTFHNHQRYNGPY